MVPNRNEDASQSAQRPGWGWKRVVLMVARVTAGLILRLAARALWDWWHNN
ncbi:MAG: hypothetical protein ABWX68_08225 [Arthrobacter sp.]|uniref:hypothetical protein n=1 Tax=Arthrobacter sp. TaxID=1667 RepID=UPI00348855DC